jgi:hypothetical protein
MRLIQNWRYVGGTRANRRPGGADPGDQSKSATFVHIDSQIHELLTSVYVRFTEPQK